MATIPPNATKLALAVLAGVSLWATGSAKAQTASRAPARSTSAVYQFESADDADVRPAYLPSAEALQAPAANPPSAPSAVVPTPNPDVFAQTGQQQQPERKPEGWANVPSYLRPTPRPGWFFLPPSGPGYY